MKFNAEAFLFGRWRAAAPARDTIDEAAADLGKIREGFPDPSTIRIVVTFIE